MASKEAYIESLQPIHPEIVYIERPKADNKTKGGIYISDNLVDKLKRSSGWGKVLKISQTISDDPKIEMLKSYLKVGNYCSFLATNPVQGGNPEHPELERIAVTDIFDTMSAEKFEEFFGDGIRL